MRRYTTLILFCIVLVTPFVLRAALGLRSTPGPASSNALRLVIISPHQEGIRREFGSAFSRWHQQKYGQPVVLDFRNYGGGSDIVKYFEAGRDTLYKATGTYGIDLVWGGGDFLFDVQLKNPRSGEGFLQGVALDRQVMQQAFPQPELAGVRLYDGSDPPQWFGTALASFGIVYNRDVVGHLGLPEPQTWADLVDPRYAGWIVLADPTRSASAKTAYMTIIERAMADAVEAGRSPDEGWADGMGRLRLIAANARFFTDSASNVPALVGQGDAAAGMAIDFYGRSQVEAVGDDRMAYVEPRGATIINPDPIALVRGAPHPDLAVRFIEFSLSEQGQRLWNTRAGVPGGPISTSLRRLPIMPSVYQNSQDFTDKVNPFETAGGFNTRADRKRTFSILGELIQVSMMDQLDELRQTRREILASPKAAELDAALARFPWDQQEALGRGEVYAKASQIERLALLRQWTAEFSEEYRRLRAEATRP
jgi:ABC-type Fe3+ transport system substrate-binding protein